MCAVSPNEIALGVSKSFTVVKQEKNHICDKHQFKTVVEQLRAKNGVKLNVQMVSIAGGQQGASASLSTHSQ